MPLHSPKPPTPPTIDKGEVQHSEPRIDAHQFFEVPEMPFSKGKGQRAESEDTPKVEETPKVNRQETTPEDMARDAVANGAGSLTKREVTRADETPIVTPSNNSSDSDRYERGQAVLREFRDEDNSAENSTPLVSYHNQNNVESHGGIFWVVTIIFVVATTFFVAKKFLFKRKPARKKSDILKNSSDKLKSTAEKFSKPEKKSPPVKPARLPKKDDDDKGKRFEVRI